MRSRDPNKGDKIKLAACHLPLHSRLLVSYGGKNGKNTFKTPVLEGYLCYHWDLNQGPSVTQHSVPPTRVVAISKKLRGGILISGGLKKYPFCPLLISPENYEYIEYRHRG